MGLCEEEEEAGGGDQQGWMAARGRVRQGLLVCLSVCRQRLDNRGSSKHARVRAFTPPPVGAAGGANTRAACSG